MTNNVPNQYVVPDDIPLEEKIDYLTNSLKTELHNRWSNTKSVEVFKALMHTYDPVEDKTLKETNDKVLANSERMLLRGQILISKWQSELEPLLKEQKKRDEEKAAKELADKLAAEEKATVDNSATIEAPAPNGRVKEKETV